MGSMCSCSIDAEEATMSAANESGSMAPSLPYRATWEESKPSDESGSARKSGEKLGEQMFIMLIRSGSRWFVGPFRVNG
jgi:hypothetical protein